MSGENSTWTAEETEATVEAYIDMARRLSSGENVNKQQVYRELASRYGRPQSIYQRKFCSFSCVLADMELPWIPGLQPLRKLGIATTAVVGQLFMDKGYAAFAATFAEHIKGGEDY